MANQTHKTDLHVHSPASTDYKGNRDKRGYLELLKAYKDASIHTIAITDHNSISGYIELQKHKEDARTNYQLNSRREDTPDFLKILKDELSCFSDISVIPGVEISCYPRVHIILLFIESIDIAKVNDFLFSDLELKNSGQAADPEIICKFSPESVLEKASTRFSEDFFCILPHVDSSKGAWQELTGKARADLFKSNKVLAAQIINPEFRKKIQEVLNNPDYKRERPLKFIQASDYHGEPSVQPAQQFIDVESEIVPDFQFLRNLFRSNKPFRISADFTDESFQKQISGKQIISFDFKDSISPSEDVFTSLCKSICACLNTRKTALLFNLLGINGTSEEIISKIKTIIEKSIDKIDPPEKFRYRLFEFTYSETRKKILFEVANNRRIRLYNSQVWIRENEQTRPANSWETERIVSETLYFRYGRSKQFELSETSQKLLMIASSYPALSIAARVDQILSNSPIFDDLVIEHSNPSYDTRLEPIGINRNGNSNGEYYLLSRFLDFRGGRLQQDSGDSYYRVTCPEYNYSSEEQKRVKTISVPANSLVIFPDGGANYCHSSLPIYSPYPLVIISMKENDPSAKELLLGLCAYLKSCFLLWYLLSIKSTDDLFYLVIEKKPRFPLPQEKAILTSLSRFVNNIIVAEQSILHKTNKLVTSELAKEKISKEVENHNSSINSMFQLIEKEILKYLRANKEEIREIFGVLKKLNYFDYNIFNGIDDFQKEVNN